MEEVISLTVFHEMTDGKNSGKGFEPEPSRYTYSTLTITPIQTKRIKILIFKVVNP